MTCLLKLKLVMRPLLAMKYCRHPGGGVKSEKHSCCVLLMLKFLESVGRKKAYKLLFSIVLTQHSCKRLPFSRIRFSNFEIFFGLVSWCWCLKYIYIWLSPFGPLYGGPGAPNVPKMTKPYLTYWNHFRRKTPKI